MLKQSKLPHNKFRASSRIDDARQPSRRKVARVRLLQRRMKWELQGRDEVWLRREVKS